MSFAPLCSVVFLRLRDFARRPVTEQARLRAQLEAALAVASADLAPEDRVVLDAADGMVVVILGKPEAALAIAERALQAAAVGMPVAVGIDHGAVRLDESGEPASVEGDGLVVAAEAAAAAEPSQLLASRAFRDALRSAAPGREARLVAAGRFTGAGLRTHEFFRTDANAEARRKRRHAILGAALALALAGTAVAARVSALGHEAFIQRLEAKAGAGWSSGAAALRSLAGMAGPRAAEAARKK